MIFQNREFRESCEFQSYFLPYQPESYGGEMVGEFLLGELGTEGTKLARKIDKMAPGNFELHF